MFCFGRAIASQQPAGTPAVNNNKEYNLMKRFMQIALIVCATSTLGLAESWTGTLIDANCKSQASSPASPEHAATSSCAPTASTKDFAVQTPDGKVYKLDRSGNSKAEAAMKSDPTKTNVTVSGSLQGQTLKVDTIDLR